VKAVEWSLLTLELGVIYKMQFQPPAARWKGQSWRVPTRSAMGQNGVRRGHHRGLEGRILRAVDVANPHVIDQAIATSRSPTRVADAKHAKVHTRTCPICAAQGQALFAFFAQWQYTLATDSAAQRAFAAQHGLCPVHTWQYQEMASPQGISDGYAPLIEALVAELSRLVKHAVEHAAVPLSALLADTTTCAACRLVREIAAEEVAQLLAHRRGAPILPHDCVGDRLAGGVQEAKDVIDAVAATAEDARLLEVRPRVPMLRERRLTTDLTGTPVENHLGELWSLLDFLNPGMLGSSLRLEGGWRNPTSEARQLLARALRPVILRRTKEQVAKDLPAKTEQTVCCELDREQRQPRAGGIAHRAADVRKDTGAVGRPVPIER